MATGTGKRPKAVVVKKAAIENTSTFLQQLPEKQKDDLSLKETIAILCDPLKSALAKGYTYPELAAMLSDKGIKISAFTLKNYVPAGKRRSAKDQTPATTRGGRKQAAKDATPAASAKLTLANSKSSTASRKPKAEVAAAKTVEPTQKATAQSTKGTAAGRRTTAAAKADSGATVKQATAKSPRTTTAKKTTDAKSSHSTTAKPAPTGSKKAKP